MKRFQLVLTISLSLCTVLPAGAYENCVRNYLGNPFMTAVCNNYCCGSSSYQYCCSQCSSSLYSSSSCGLPAQVIAGIVVGCIAFAILVAILVLVIIYVRKRKRMEIHASPMDETGSTTTENCSKGDDIFNAESSSSSEMVIMRPPPPSYNYTQPNQGGSSAKSQEVPIE